MAKRRRHRPLHAPASPLCAHGGDLAYVIPRYGVMNGSLMTAALSPSGANPPSRVMAALFARRLAPRVYILRDNATRGRLHRRRRRCPHPSAHNAQLPPSTDQADRHHHRPQRSETAPLTQRRKGLTQKRGCQSQRQKRWVSYLAQTFAPFLVGLGGLFPEGEGQLCHGVRSAQGFTARSAREDHASNYGRHPGTLSPHPQTPTPDRLMWR
jgi:hypothetical protein